MPASGTVVFENGRSYGKRPKGLGLRSRIMDWFAGLPSRFEEASMSAALGGG